MESGISAGLFGRREAFSANSLRLLFSFELLRLLASGKSSQREVECAIFARLAVSRSSMALSKVLRMAAALSARSWTSSAPWAMPVSTSIAASTVCGAS